MKLPSSDQQDFADSVAALLEKRDPLAPMRHAVGPRVLDADLWSDLLATGVLEPAEAGDVLTACLVAEALGHRAAPVPFLSASLAASLGDSGTIGLLGADGLFSSTPLAYDGDRARGVLPFVPDADVAESVVVLVETTDGPRLASVVPVSVTPLETLDGTQPLFRVSVDSPVAVLPGAPDDTLRSSYELGVALHCASLLGAMTWLLDTTVEYAGQRVQFGMPIAARQAVKHHAATLLMRVESARSMVLELADVLESGTDRAVRARAVSTTKSWVSDAAEEVASTALQLHGGIGFTWEHDLHHYFKRCVVGATLLGTAAHHRARLVEQLRAS